jgi:hypothetical protein
VADIAAADLQPGMRVVNPVWDTGQPEVLQVLEVSRPDADGMVVITAVDGTAVVAGDWPVEEYTAEQQALEETLIAMERSVIAP